MNNNERLIIAFSESLNINPAEVRDELAYNSIPQWDSVAHMVLVAKLEGEFDVMLEMDDIIDMNSVGKSREILAQHGVVF